MFENIIKFFKKFGKNEKDDSKNMAKERLHLVLAQDRANISADFLEMMKQEIIDVIKKYIDIDEQAIDVKMTNKPGEDGTVGAPSLYANIPILTIKNEARKLEGSLEKQSNMSKEKSDEQEKDIKNEENAEDIVETAEEVIEEKKAEVVTEIKEETQELKKENIKLDKENNNKLTKKKKTDKKEEVKNEEKNS